MIKTFLSNNDHQQNAHVLTTLQYMDVLIFLHSIFTFLLYKHTPIDTSHVLISLDHILKTGLIFL